MATVKMMQGDSFAVFFAIRLQDTGDLITPYMVSEVEVSIGDSIRKTYTSGEVSYDATQLQWYFVPTQEETFSLDPDSYEVQARVKFRNEQYSSVRGTNIGSIMILDAQSEEVI